MTLDHGFTFVRDLAHFEVWRSREQHVADSSNHSLYLIKLFNSSDPEGNMLSGMSRFARQYRPETPRKCALIKHSSPSFGSWHVCSYSVCGVCALCGYVQCVCGVFSCVCVCVLVCVVVCGCVCGCGVSQTLSRSRFSYTYWCKRSLWKVLETATRSKKHETIVEGQRLWKAVIMESKCSRLRFSMIKWAKKSDADMYMYIFLNM